MSFFGSFFGNDQRKDLERANASANASLKQGYDESQGRYDQAFDLYNPYAQQGQQGQQFYTNALGLNGADAMGDAYNTITSNPMFQNTLDQQSNAMTRYLNARGGAAGGRGQVAAQQVFQSNIGNWLDRYRDVGQQGLQATGQQAGIRTGQGDAAYGYGATKAGQAINYGNAMAANRNTGINNLLNLAGTAAKGAGMFMGGPAGMAAGMASSAPVGSYGTYGKSWQPVIT